MQFNAIYAIFHKLIVAQLWQKYHFKIAFSIYREFDKSIKHHTNYHFGCICKENTFGIF